MRLQPTGLEGNCTVGKHRKSSDSHATRRVGMSVATVALGVTGLGFSGGTAFADSGSFNANKFRELMTEPLDTFASTQKQHDPNDSTPDADGMRWDRDGCSVPGPVNSAATFMGQPLRGTPADDACNRHDAAYRTLQKAGRWNPNSHADADRRFAADLHDLQQGGKISEVQETGLALGAGLGSKLPSAIGSTEINGLPEYDGSTDSPYQDPAADTHRSKRSLDDPEPPQEPDSGPRHAAGGPDPDSQEAGYATARQEGDPWGDSTSQGSDEAPESVGMSEETPDGSSFAPSNDDSFQGADEGTFDQTDDGTSEQPEGAFAQESDGVSALGQASSEETIDGGSFDQSQNVSFPASDDGSSPCWGDGFAER
ncbi:phospholipase A2 [Streptomyces sp. NPDC005728]|uniref:phospholipase A2 n=1 Tax=Streptomyces sp. NPDC005728 TaxID=3157054 RepID=UPI0033D9D2AC